MCSSAKALNSFEMPSEFSSERHRDVSGVANFVVLQYVFFGKALYAVKPCQKLYKVIEVTRVCTLHFYKPYSTTNSGHYKVKRNLNIYVMNVQE